MGYPEAQYVINELGDKLGAQTFTLDDMLSAKIVCRGYLGTKFTITRTDDYYPDVTAEITVNSRQVGNYYVEIVSVPVGMYNIVVELDGEITTSSVVAETLGQHYTFAYAFEPVLIEEITANATYTIPDDLDYVYVTACGAGGGGGGGGWWYNNNSGYGGGGGGGAESVKLLKIETPRTFDITIGEGGAGGGVASSASVYGADEKYGAGHAGSTGGSTVIGNIVTLAGGTGGSYGIRGSASETEYGGVGGTIGGGQGGRGAIKSINRQTTVGSAGQAGALGGAGGAGGAAGGDYYGLYYYGAGGGGGGGCIGAGGNGAAGTIYEDSIGTAGVGGYGAGGGGGGGGGQSKSGGSPSAGGKGGNGVVRIYKGVSFE